MKILGIDPGSVYCGYGVVVAESAQKTVQAPGRSNTDQSKRIAYGASGRIVLPAKKPLEVRLLELFCSLQDVISEFTPDAIAVERIFFAKSTKSALTLGHTRGVVLLAVAQSGKPLHEYSALEVKKAVVGYGRAEKAQVEAMVRQILGIRHVLSPDSADALALALCHAHQQSFAEASGKLNPLLAPKTQKPKAKSRK
ncbi:MAG TPA: crossover junction endodeoxyribonuclease RuvC [Dissulfurispiraceae bacterium]|nr:crossover junction endodeoxyribonuclease RuvC [Dissulfurispiraceae bacterium]